MNYAYLIKDRKLMSYSVKIKVIKLSEVLGEVEEVGSLAIKDIKVTMEAERVGTVLRL